MISVTPDRWYTVIHSATNNKMCIFVSASVSNCIEYFYQSSGKWIKSTTTIEVNAKLNESTAEELEKYLTVYPLPSTLDFSKRIKLRKLRDFYESC